jgi:hypothetical protein
MATVPVTVLNRNWLLTDEHAASSYGSPVLVGDDDVAYGPWDIPVREGSAYRYARAIASYIRDDRPDDVPAMALLDKFLAVRAS